jgi:acetyltransferase-like isoleucine patch superfamily enzyme
MISEAITHIRAGRFDAALLSLTPTGYDNAINPDNTSIVKEIASKFKHDPPRFTNNKKLKIGYITEGFDFTQAPVKRMLYLSEYHDKDALDITYFSRIAEEDRPGGHENYNTTITRLSEDGCKVVTSPRFGSPLDRSLWLFDAIRQERIDVLVTYAMYTVPYLHFLCAMKPAPVLVKDCLQQPEFSDLPDATIHHTRQTMKGDKGYCRLLPARYPKPEKYQAFKKYEFNIPDTAPVFASIGRPGKFRQSMFKKAIEELLEYIPDAYFLGIGSVEPSLDRQINIGVQEHPVDILRDVADVYLDTFPLGGGWTIAESIYSGIPIVMFEAGETHNVLETTLPEVLGIPELTIKRWDIQAWKKKAEALISGNEYRDTIKEQLKIQAQVISDYAGYIRERESLYAELVISKRCIRKCLMGDGALKITPPIYANNRPETIYFDNSADIIIGRGLSIGQEVTILTHEHYHDKGLPIGEADAVCSSLEIGDHVQIGVRALILPKCNRIGHGAVIGAGSVVTKDIPDNEIWAGNPARKIRDRM